MNLQHGDILLVKVGQFSTWYRWLLARLIQLFDRTYYHHCALFVDGEIHEADSRGVITRTPDWYANDEVCVMRLIQPISEAERFRYLNAARAQLDKKYDYWGTLFFQLIYRLSGIWIGPRRRKAQRKLFCSEHCILPIHQVRGYYHAPWRVSPGDIKRSSGYYYVVYEGRLRQ